LKKLYRNVARQTDRANYRPSLAANRLSSDADSKIAPNKRSPLPLPDLSIRSLHFRKKEKLAGTPDSAALFLVFCEHN